MQTMVDQAEIHRKAVSGDVEERRWAAGQLSDNFADLPDKELAWKDIIRLTQDDWLVRFGVEGALDHAFQHVPQKAGMERPDSADR